MVKPTRKIPATRMIGVWKPKRSVWFLNNDDTKLGKRMVKKRKKAAFRQQVMQEDFDELRESDPSVGIFPYTQEQTRVEMMKQQGYPVKVGKKEMKKFLKKKEREGRYDYYE